VAGRTKRVEFPFRLACHAFFFVRPPVREKRTEVSHMKNNVNQSKRIYDKTTKQWYEIPEDQYREYDRWRTALRKRMQYRGECFCPRSKWWLCDGNCLDCEFHNNTTVSLDDPLPDGEGTLADYVPDDAPLIEEVLSEKAELDQLFERLQELMPEAKRIGELREEGLSDEAIADTIGIKRTTFLSRLKKAEGKLSQEFPDWF
jgi:DNA-directed RNA polymerase specialized sigma24 family protein